MASKTLGFLALVLAVPAQAQMYCGDREMIVNSLANKYGETVVGQALTNDGRIIELLTPPDGETFTLILSMADGASCVLITGYSWEKYDPKPPEEGL